MRVGICSDPCASRLSAHFPRLWRISLRSRLRRKPAAPPPLLRAHEAQYRAGSKRRRSGPRLKTQCVQRWCGAQGRIRTTDTRIFSPLLYQLSYLGLAALVAEPLRLAPLSDREDLANAAARGKMPNALKSTSNAATLSRLERSSANRCVSVPRRRSARPPRPDRRDPRQARRRRPSAIDRDRHRRSGASRTGDTPPPWAHRKSGKRG